MDRLSGYGAVQEGGEVAAEETPQTGTQSRSCARPSSLLNAGSCRLAKPSQFKRTEKLYVMFTGFVPLSPGFYVPPCMQSAQAEPENGEENKVRCWEYWNGSCTCSGLVLTVIKSLQYASLTSPCLAKAFNQFLSLDCFPKNSKKLLRWSNSIVLQAKSHISKNV